MKKKFLLLFLGLLTHALAAQAPTTLPQPITPAAPAKQTAIEQAGSPPASLNLADFPADSVEDVVVPVPSEIFGVLDKLGNPNWKSQLRLSKTHTPEERSQIALLLGSVIAEGFVAVEAEDAERVKELGRDVLSLADAVNVRKSVIARSKSIIEKADHRDWRGVRSEFDGARNDVQAAMDEMNDRNLAQLVSLGGWLRGTDVLTAIVDANYTADGAELLHQPELVRYFKRCIAGMSPRLRKNNLVLRIDKVLDQIAPIVGEKKGSIQRAKIEKIHTLTSEIVALINATS
ncbi:MAG: hypothetical protein FJ390_00520 [Verrucomicrobia bacterium]|nr:hypothetical protein [Verrucomicrobiota bacterium]